MKMLAQGEEEGKQVINGKIEGAEEWEMTLKKMREDVE